MTENGGFGEGSGIFFAFLIFAFGGGAWSGWGRNGFAGAAAALREEFFKDSSLFSCKIILKLL